MDVKRFKVIGSSVRPPNRTPSAPGARVAPQGAYRPQVVQPVNPNLASNTTLPQTSAYRDQGHQPPHINVPPRPLGVPASRNLDVVSKRPASTLFLNQKAIDEATTAFNPQRPTLQSPTAAVNGQQPASPASGPVTNVSINISLPKLKKPTAPRLPTLPYKKIAICAAVLLVLVGAGLTARFFIVQHQRNVRIKAAEHAVSDANQLHRTTPSFVPVVPKSDPSLGTVNGVSTAFDGSRDTVSYADTLNGNMLTVSQQPIPTSFKSATEAVATIAKSLGATTPIIVGGNSAYIATDAKSGAQTIVYSLNNVLIFIQSPYTHSTDQWTGYLSNLTTT